VGKRVKAEMLGGFHDQQKPFKYSNNLLFCADFECGNLHSVFRDKRTNVNYLTIQNDVNTHGYNQWFYFSIRSLLAKKYRFIIINLTKEIKCWRDLKLLTFSKNKKKYTRTVSF